MGDNRDGRDASHAGSLAPPWDVLGIKAGEAFKPYLIMVYRRCMPGFAYDLSVVLAIGVPAVLADCCLRSWRNNRRQAREAECVVRATAE